MRRRLCSIGVMLAAILVLMVGGSGLASAGAAERSVVPAAATDDCGQVPPPKDDETISVVGCLSDTRTDPPTPVQGVKLTVTDEAGAPVADGVSGADGRFEIPLGEALDVLGGRYVVKLDVDTLPEDSFLTREGDVSRTININIDEDIALSYPIGPDVNAEDPLWDQALDLTVSGLIFGLLLAVAAIGLSLVFGTTGLTNFAHGELVTFGAIVAYLIDTKAALPIFLIGLLTVVLAGGFGWAQDAGVWKPLRRRGTGLLAMMIISIGISIFLRNLYQYFVGADTHNYSQYATVAPWEIGPLSVTWKDLLVGVICVVVLVAVSIAVQRTRLGKATRAVSDNPALAASTGINVDRVIRVVWVIGTALAGLAGFLFGLTQGLDYQTGFKILLLIFAAVTLGGLGNIWGAMVGGLIIGLLVEVSTLVIPSELKYVGALVVLILVLLVRPQGLLGRAERVG